MRTAAILAIALALGACAGRPPALVAVVQPQDRALDCTQVSAEIAANDVKIRNLGSEEGGKVAQNVAAGVVGLFFFPALFLMDVQGTASKETAALQSRNQYLGTVAAQKNCGAS